MSRKASALSSTSSDAASVSPSPADEWVELFGCSAPRRMDALVGQAVAWQRQRLVHGDIAPAIARDLAVISADAGAQRAIRDRNDAGKPVISADHDDNVGNPVSKGASRDDNVGAPVAKGSLSDDAADAPPAIRAARSSSPSLPRRVTPLPLPPASSQLLVGTRLVKTHGGQTHVVEVTADGMLYAGETFTSLSAVAKRITGTHWNGLLFFGLRRRKTYPAKASAHG